MSSVGKVLLTGATGYVGGALLDSLVAEDKYSINIASRRQPPCKNKGINFFQIDNLDAETNWSEALSGVDCVIHLAGLAHVFRGGASHAGEFRKVNFHGTVRLAEQAVIAGVKRFVFVSSIGVNGTPASDSPFSEADPANPCSDYARSKFDSELALQEIAVRAGMEVVIVRPPLVYGARAPGNFQRMLKLVYSRLPLPFGLVNNRRSLVSLANLVDFITLCVDHPAAANEIFLVSDGVDVSTAELVRYLAAGMGRRSFLVPVPVSLMHVSSRLFGFEAMYTQLFGSLVIDSSKSRDRLGWRPPYIPEHELFRAGKHYSCSVQSGKYEDR